MPMYTSSYLKPDGTPYMISGPAGASPKDVDERVLLRHPEARKASEIPKPEPVTQPTDGGPPDVPGRKAPTKELTGKDLAQIAVQGVMAIPGEGVLPAVGRVAAATGLTGALTKGDLWETAKAGAEALGGNVLGGVARAGARQIGSALDKTMPQLTALIKRVLPEAAGSTPAETVNRILGGEAKDAVGNALGDTRRRLWDKYINPNQLPGMAFPKQLNDSAKETLYGAVQQLGTPAERMELKAMDRKYFVASGIEDWFKSAYTKGLIPGTGKYNVRALQETFAPERGKLADIIPGVEGPLRMPLSGAAMDIPAKSPYMSAHMNVHSPMPGFRFGMPHAARLSGEGITPELAAQAARQLGAYGVGQVIPAAP